MTHLHDDSPDDYLRIPLTASLRARQCTATSHLRNRRCREDGNTIRPRIPLQSHPFSVRQALSRSHDCRQSLSHVKMTIATQTTVSPERHVLCPPLPLQSKAIVDLQASNLFIHYRTSVTTSSNCIIVRSGARTKRHGCDGYVPNAIIFIAFLVLFFFPLLLCVVVQPLTVPRPASPVLVPPPQISAGHQRRRCRHPSRPLRPRLHLHSIAACIVGCGSIATASRRPQLR